jgi:hypothetical protein
MEHLMTDIIRLDPHDPLPEAKPFALVIRRFGEDDPNALVTEIDFMGSHPTMSVATGAGGAPLAWEDAVQQAHKEAASRGFKTLYAVDRTAGRREQAIIGRHGDHSTHDDALSDTDEEDGVEGSTILDRGHDAGFMR